MDNETVLTLPGMEAAALNPLEEAQQRSTQARALFESAAAAEPWMDDYYSLIGEGYTWRQAVWMIWMAQPKSSRQPKTQHELATQVLGLSSDRIIREWREKFPLIEERIRRLTLRALFHARADALAALAELAGTVSYRTAPDRKLLLEMTGDYVPKQGIDIGVRRPEEIHAASSDELLALAQAGESKPDGE